MSYIHYTIYSVHCTLYTIYNVYCTMYNVQYIIYTIHCTQYVHLKLHTTSHDAEVCGFQSNSIRYRKRLGEVQVSYVTSVVRTTYVVVIFAYRDMRRILYVAVHCMPYSVRCTAYSVWCTVYGVRFTMCWTLVSYCVQCTHCAMYTV